MPDKDLPRWTSSRGPYLPRPPAQPSPDILRDNYSRASSTVFGRLNAGLSRDFRTAAIERCGLRPGKHVLDLGCGTGLSFDGLAEGVGASGSVVGIDASHEMVARSMERVAAAGWENVAAVETSAQEFTPTVPFDAILVCSVNQLICSPETLLRVVSWLKPDGVFVAAGGRRGTGIKAAFNATYLRLVVPLVQKETSALQWILHKTPWQEMEPLLADVQVEFFAGDSAFVAWGTVRK